MVRLPCVCVLVAGTGAAVSMVRLPGSRAFRRVCGRRAGQDECSDPVLTVQLSGHSPPGDDLEVKTAMRVDLTRYATWEQVQCPSCGRYGPDVPGL